MGSLVASAVSTAIEMSDDTGDVTKTTVGVEAVPDEDVPGRDYPHVPFDIDRDISEGVLGSCVEQIKGNFYSGRRHGVQMVVDKETAYYNASLYVTDENDMKYLMEGEIMKNCFDYIRKEFNKRPFYRVEDQECARLNGVYMHGLTLGNVLGHALPRETAV